MQRNILHILLSFLLLFAYSAERLLPCAGEWDIDCQDKESVPAALSADHSDHDHSEESGTHSEGNCICPCHAPSTPLEFCSDLGVLGIDHDFASGNVQFFSTTLPPPDHIPIV